MKTKENLKNNNFTKLTRSGISLIVLVITIIVVIILAAAIIISLNNNNPIMEANTARYESDRANMQAVFTNAVAKVMAKNQATVSVSPGQINTITGGQKEVEGEVAYTLTDAQNSNFSSGKIVFDKNKPNTDTIFYTGKKLPIYGAGETKWYVDEEGNISLEVAGTKYGSGEISESGATQPKPATFGEAYAIYSDDDKSLTFMRSETEPVVGEKYKEKTITEVYKEFEENEYVSDEGVNTPWGWSMYKYDVLKVSFDDVIKPISCQAFLADLRACELLDVTNLDTSEVTNMNYMFELLGMDSSNCTIIGLDKIDTTNVTTMIGTFSNVGYNSNSITLSGINSMDVSNVQKMSSTFVGFGYNSKDVVLNLNNWNTSNVTDMRRMFDSVGYNASTLRIEGIENWDVSNVEDMSYMFSGMGGNCEPFTLDISGWNNESVTNASKMFKATKKLKQISLGSSWKWVGSNSYLEVPLDSNISGADGKWYNVSTKEGFIPSAIPENTSATYTVIPLVERVKENILLNGRKFNETIPSNAKSIEFLNTAPASGVTLKDVSEAQDGSVMAWLDGTTYKVAPHESGKTIYANPDSSFMFFSSTRITASGWVNSTAILNSIKLDNFDTSKVTSMSYMFAYAGDQTSTFTISGLEKFDTSNVTDMSNMFRYTYGSGTSSFKLEGLENWDVSNVKEMAYMFESSGYKASSWDIGDISGWDVSNVTGFSYMFRSAGAKNANYTLDLTSWKTKIKETANHFDFNEDVESKVISPWD